MKIEIVNRVVKNVIYYPKNKMLNILQPIHDLLVLKSSISERQKQTIKMESRNAHFESQKIGSNFAFFLVCFIHQLGRFCLDVSIVKTQDIFVHLRLNSSTYCSLFTTCNKQMTNKQNVS